jgi:hypothetical protein
MPNRAVSARSTRLNPSIANLAAWWEAMPGATDAAAHRRELHDQCAALFSQHGDGRLRDVVDTPQVGLELGAEVLVVSGLDR